MTTRTIIEQIIKTITQTSPAQVEHGQWWIISVDDVIVPARKLHENWHYIGDDGEVVKKNNDDIALLSPFIQPAHKSVLVTVDDYSQVPVGTYVINTWHEVYYKNNVDQWQDLAANEFDDYGTDIWFTNEELQGRPRLVLWTPESLNQRIPESLNQRIPEQVRSKREKEIISNAELAVLASRRTGEVLPRYFYHLAGVPENEIPEDAVD